MQVAPGIDREDVSKRLRSIWSEVLGIELIEDHQDFMEIGGDSINMQALAARIEQEFGIKVGIFKLWENRTVAGQTNVLLRGKLPENDQSSLICVQPFGTLPPIFFLHTLGGTVAYCFRLAKYLGARQPVYGLQSKALAGKPAHFSIPEMASDYLEELRSVQHHGPYHLCGYCSGGLIAFELAQQLAKLGEKVCFLGMIDTPAPGSFRLGLGGLLVHVMKKTGRELRMLRKMKRQEQSARALRKARKLAVAVRDHLRADLWRRRMTRLDNRALENLVESTAEIQYVNAAASETYLPTSLCPLPITLFQSGQINEQYSVAPAEGWSLLMGSTIELVDLPRTEEAPLEQRAVEVIADRIRGCNGSCADLC